MLVRPILVEVLKRDRYRRLRSGGRRDSGVDVSDLHGLGMRHMDVGMRMVIMPAMQH